MFSRVPTSYSFVQHNSIDLLSFPLTTSMYVWYVYAEFLPSFSIYLDGHTPIPTSKCVLDTGTLEKMKSKSIISNEYQKDIFTCYNDNNDK